MNKMTFRRVLAVAVAAVLVGCLLPEDSYAASSWQYRIPVDGLRATQPALPEEPETPSEPLSLELGSATLPPATRNTAYLFDFSSLLTLNGEPQPAFSSLVWSLGEGQTLPQGLALSATGEISGTPTRLGTSDFEVKVSYEDANSERTYRIVVNGLALDIVQMAAGNAHNCVLTGEGAVWCWGRNDYGQLGDGTTTERTTPQQITALGTGVQFIAADSFNTCALKDSAVLCWGRNDSGQVGDGIASTNRATPQLVQGVSGAISVAMGGYHACAALQDGSVRCWGKNDRNQLGAQAGAFSASPVTVTGFSGSAIAVDAGESHTCARLAGGAISCWGRNDYGQLGDGTTQDQSQPRLVAIGAADAVFTGAFHTCAQIAGTVSCWGRNEAGDLGRGTVTSSEPIPQNTLPLGGSVRTAVSSNRHTCVILENQTVVCWGLDSSGQLGDGSAGGGNSVPKLVAGVADAVTLSSGGHFTCVTTSAGEAQCWGANNYGQIGDGTKGAAPKLQPTDVVF